MNKSRIIGSLLLVFILCGSLSCQNRCNSCPPEGWATQNLAASSGTQPAIATPPAPPPAPQVRPIAVQRPICTESYIEPTTTAKSKAGNNSYIVSRLYPCAECGLIRVDKSMPEQANLNEPFDYSIKLTNLTDRALTDVLIIEDVPESFKLISSHPPAKNQLRQLVWEVDSLEPRATRQISITGKAAEGGLLKHCTTVVTEAIPACTTVKVTQPKLELLRVAPTEVALCEQIIVNYGVANSGTGDVGNVTLVETLPAGLLTSDGKSEIAFCVGHLAPGQSQQFSAELKAARSGKYACRTVASSPAGPRAESVATLTVGQPVLAISQNIPERHYLSRPIAYDITVTNKGDGPAKNTVIENTIPPAVTSIKASAGAKLSGSRLLWRPGTISAGDSKTVRVSYMPTKPGTLDSSTVVTATCIDKVTASAKTEVSGIAGLLLEVGDVDDPVQVKKKTTYAITVTNQGSAASTNIRIVCTLEENEQYVSSRGPTAGTLEGNNVNFVPLATLAPGVKATWNVVVTAVKPGDVRFKVIMTADQLTRPVEETEATHLYE